MVQKSMSRATFRILEIKIPYFLSNNLPIWPYALESFIRKVTPPFEVKLRMLPEVSGTKTVSRTIGVLTNM